MQIFPSKRLKRGIYGTATRHLWRGVGSVLGLLVLLWSQTAPAATITVTTAVDDIIPNNGSVSLREAITAINNGNDIGDPDIAMQSPGTFGTNDTINFNIPGAGVQTINVGADASANGFPFDTITSPVTINGYSQPGTKVNTIANSGNAVLLIELNGTDAGFGSDALTLGPGSGGSTIRGLVINRFVGHGIVILSDGNTINGNFIGTNPGGGTRMPNGTFPGPGDGILIQNASSNHIGSPDPADRNVISGNAVNGVHIVGTLTAPANGNFIQGNFIGIDRGGINGVGTRTEPAPAPSTTEGNNLNGIEISGGTNNVIGGSNAGDRNVIGFNAEGIALDNGAQANIIQGNFIGVGANGVTPTANLLHGVVVHSSNGFVNAPLGPAQPNEPGVSFNFIGGTLPGAGNLIEFNGTGGVAVFGNPVSASGQANFGNAILGNSIFENGRSNGSPALLGIDLSNTFTYPKDDGLTPNDSKGHGAANDPNKFLNFPVLTSAITSGGTTHIAGTLGSVANTTFRLEFFASNSDPLALPAEGQEFLGFINVTTGANGKAPFNLPLGSTVANGRIVTATATDPTGNTSEFSKGIVVPTQPPSPTPTPTATATAKPTATATAKPTATATAKPTATATATPKATATSPTAAPAAHALNISTRMLVQGGNNVLIAGFIVTGAAPKIVAVRGLGPSLAQFFTGTLTDPTLELHSGNTTLKIDDDWQADSAQAAQLTSHGLALSNSKEAGIVATLPSPGSYTAIMSGKNGGTGIGLVELYDLNQGANSQLANISTRGFVQTGNKVMIGGFILGGNAGNTHIAVRGIGPSLAQFGLSPVLADPTLELHNANGVTLIGNDNWQDNPVSAAQLTAHGLALSNPKEAGIFTSLPPGQFTAVLAGKNGGVGIGLVEIYNVQ